ncbi:MAG: hypothetical protein EXS08_15485 [Planctomycetes bacterium]|nr:hypothetical protein [Planctomycetota bacterium]
MFSVLCLLILCAFLGCLGLFALAVTKVVAPDGRGHTRGFAGSCAAMLAVFLLCSLGLAGLAATVAAIGIGSVSHWNPIRHIEVSRARLGREHDGWRDQGDEQHALSARFTVRGDAGAELVELLHGLVEVDLDELGDGLTVQHRTDAQGEEFSVYEFRLPISEHELERFEHDVQSGLDGLKLRLPERIDIEFDGAK